MVGGAAARGAGVEAARASAGASAGAATTWAAFWVVRSEPLCLVSACSRYSLKVW